MLTFLILLTMSTLAQSLNRAQWSVSKKAYLVITLSLITFGPKNKKDDRYADDPRGAILL